MAWAEPAFPLPVPPVSDIENGTVDESITPQDVKPFVIELLRKTNFCPTEWKKYFIPTESEEGGRGFNEAKEKVIFDAMFEKTNW